MAEAQVLAHRLDELQPETVHWLWPGYIPRAKMTLIDGDPGQGKSMLTLDLAARVTTGRPWPDGAAGAPPGNVLIVNCEDGLRDTILPRLHALGADTRRVHAYQGYTVEEKFVSLPVFPRDVPHLRGLIDRHKIQLVVVDPLMAFLDLAFSSINDQSVRRALLPLAVAAEETGCALLVVRHLNKTGGGRAIYRGSGSIGIIGAARMAFLVGRNPDDPDGRVLACLKSNLTTHPLSLGFRVATAPGSAGAHLDWQGPVEHSADDLLSSPARKENHVDRAKEFLKQQLQHGAVEVNEMLDRGRAAGLSQRTLELTIHKLPANGSVARRGRIRCKTRNTACLLWSCNRSTMMPG